MSAVIPAKARTAVNDLWLWTNGGFRILPYEKSWMAACAATTGDNYAISVKKKLIDCQILVAPANRGVV
jgi:hypothetical protein